jgi:hypothetical protein
MNHMYRDDTSFIFKIFDYDCPVCAEMAPIEIEVTEKFHIGFPRISLEQAVHYKEIFNYLSLEVAEDGSVDLPVYLKIDDNGYPTSHLTGRQTLNDLLKLFSS